MKSIKSHIKSVTLNDIVSIHQVHFVGRCIEHAYTNAHHRIEHLDHHVRPTRYCTHRTLYHAHRSVKYNREKLMKKSKMKC